MFESLKNKYWPMIFVLITLAVTGVVTTGQARSIEEVTINYIEASTAPDKLANEVRAYITVTDAEGKPIQGLQHDNFEALEDGRPLDIQEINRTSDPMSLVLAIDTSGSMQARDKAGTTSMESAKRAAIEFISMLERDDQVALFSFNNEPILEIDFTTDHDAVADAINGLRSKINAATRLYDTAMEAVKKSAEIPRGRRAVILLTDGRDEKSGQKFSLHSSTDVIDAATTKAIRVPIYTIGAGPQVDKRELGRLAGLTGGRSLLAVSPGQLRDFYRLIADQLKNQYALVYRTRGPSGEHSLVVKVKNGESRGQDERRLWAPPLPVRRAPVVSFIRPSPNTPVKGETEIALHITPEESVSKVRYFVDSSLKEEVTSPPFKGFIWDTAGLSPGLHLLRVEVVDVHGQIGRAEVTVKTISPVKAESSPAPKEAKGEIFPGIYLIGLIILGVLIIGLCLVFFFLRKKQSEEPVRPVLQPGSVTQTRETFSAPVPADDDRTMFLNDSQETSEETLIGPEKDRLPLATLTVVKSLNLDPGKIFEIYDKITIGRNSTNDIFIPDKPVSRKHAEIYLESGELYIRDLGSRNGTMVNEKETPAGGCKLENESLIQLSSRTILEFRVIPQEEENIGEDDETKVGHEIVNNASDDDTKIYD